MAGETEKRQVILNVDTTANTAAENIEKLVKELETLKATQKQLTDENKKGTSAYEKNAAQIRNVQAAIRQQRTNLSNAIALENKNTKTLAEMRKELKLVTTAYDNLSAAERAGSQGNEYQKKIQQLTADISAAEQETGRFQRNVGNYENAMRKAISASNPMISFLVEMQVNSKGAGGFFKALGTQIKAATQAAWAFIKTPVGAALAAIAVVVKSVAAGIKSSEENTNRWREIMAGFQPVLNAVTKGLQIFAEWVLKGVEAIGKFIGKVVDKIPDSGFAKFVKEVSSESERLVETQKASAEIDRMSRQNLIKNAEDQKKIAELRAKAKDEEKYTAEERLAFLDEAIKLEENIARRDTELAQERYRVAMEEAKATGNRKETNDELARLYAEQMTAETHLNNTLRRLSSERQALRKEIADADAAAAADSAKEAQERNAVLLSTIESISGMLQKTTEEQIADVNKLYEEAYAQIEKLRGEQTPPERAGFATDEEYEAAMSRYNDFMLNIAVTQTRLEKQQADAVAQIRKGVQDKMDKEQADALAKAAAERKAQLDTDLLLADDNARAKYEAKIKYLNEELEAVKGNAQAEARIQQQMVDVQREFDKSRIESFEKYSAQVMSGLNTVNELFNALGNAQLEKTRDRYNQEQEALQAKLDAGLISQELYNERLEQLDAELAAEEAKVARQQAIRERALSVFQIIIDTAVAVMKTYKELGPIGGAIASAAVSALGAIQLATVMAEPLPKAARGRYIQGRRHSQGGEIIEAEDGEFIMNRRSVQMFWPELSAMSVAGGGVPFQVQDGGYTIRNSVRTQSEAMQGVQLRTVVDELSQQNHEELICLTRATISAIANLKIYASVEDIRRGDKNYVNIENRSTL